MLLAIETAETACSAALIVGETLVDERHEPVGRGHAERLIPMIAEMLDGRLPAGIVVDCGPGSFTGLRVGLAAARGLALGWSVPVTGYSSLSLLAISAFRRHPVDNLAVAMTGGHGQVFVECFRRAPFMSLMPLASLDPLAAADICIAVPLVVGSGIAALQVVTERPIVAAEGFLPRASDVRFLPEAFRLLPPRPIYGRPPDAKPQAR